MAKDIKFNIKLKVDGKEQLVTASASSKELAEQLNIARQAVDGLSRAFIDLNQTVEIVQNIGEAFSRLSAHMREVTQANALVSQLTGEAGDGMLRLRNGVQAVSDYFGKDFAEVLRAVNNLSKGFGISAGEALALVRSGLVSGADAGRGGVSQYVVREFPS